MEFKDRLKSLRAEKAVTLDDMTKKIGITSAALSRYENGHRTPPLEIAIMLAEYFNVSLDYLAGISDNRMPFDKNARTIDFISLVLEGLHQRGYNYSDKPMEELIDIIINAIKIDEILKKRD